MKRYFISKKEARALRNRAQEVYPWLELRFKRVEVIEDRWGRIYIVDGEPVLLERDDRLIPLLTYLLRHPGVYEKMPVIIIDMGAVKAMTRGADLMVPGVRGIRGVFRQGDIVVAVDEKYGKPVMVGEALIASEDVLSGSVKRGKMVKNLHHIGDDAWRLAASL